jgi:hypothetical protein
MGWMELMDRGFMTRSQGLCLAKDPSAKGVRTFQLVQHIPRGSDSLFPAFAHASCPKQLVLERIT